MIRGCGIDIVEIARLKKAVERWGDDFLQRVFTTRELEYSRSKKFPFQHLAGRFAAKEAVFKALGPGRRLNFKDIEILNKPDGGPFCLVGESKEPIHISLSHSDHHAIACAVVEKKGPNA